MPSSPYIEVSQETRARIAELRRRASADEGRQVTNEEIVRRLIDAAELDDLFPGTGGMGRAIIELEGQRRLG
jgi:hypothetical protein